MWENSIVITLALGLLANRLIANTEFPQTYQLKIAPTLTRELSLMTIVYNPKAREPKLSDRDESPAVKCYLRLRSYPEGETFFSARGLRDVFAVNGVATHDRISERLDELSEARLVTYQRTEQGGRVAYRIVLEPLPEELPENALAVPKSIKQDMTEAQQVAQLFYKLQDEKLGVITSFTVKDWQNCRRLLKDNSLAVVKGAVKRFWETKADQRKNPTFNEFRFNFLRLANDAKDELEVEAAIKADKARKERPKETEREYLIREIKYQSTRDPVWAEKLKAELEALDGEEEARD